MDGCMDGWMDGWIDGWMDALGHLGATMGPDDRRRLHDLRACVLRFSVPKRGHDHQELLVLTSEHS